MASAAGPLSPPQRGALLLLLLGAGAAVHAALGSPGLVHLPGWFYRPTRPGLDVGLVGPLALALALALAAVAHRWAPKRRGAALLAVFGASLFAQAGFMALDAQGLAHFWGRLMGGHGEFLRVAHERPDLLSTLKGYERLVAAGELGHFPPSKPPGALAAYVLVDRLGELLRGPLAPLVTRAEGAGVAPHAAGAAVALWLFPLLTALAAPLTMGLARAFGRARTGAVAGILVAFAPTTVLVTHHLDGALYPLLALGAAWCWAVAAAGEGARRHLAAAAGGALLALGVYTSFSLLPAGLLAATLALGTWWRRRSERRTDLGHALGAGAAATVAFVAVVAALVLALDFQPWARFEGAMAHHAQWKAAVPTALWRVIAPLELFLWVGWPMVLVWLVGLGPARSPDAQRWVGRLVLAVLLLASALSGTNEVARIWAFFVPFIALSVALAYRWERAPLAALVAAQLATGLALAAAGPW